MSRKDKKGRVLRQNEYVREDGRYVYQYKDLYGKRKMIYSWRLLDSDPQPKDKPQCECLRVMESQVEQDLISGIETNNKATLNDRWDDYIANKPKLKESTRANYRYMYDKYVRENIGNAVLKTITFSMVRKFFNYLICDVGLQGSTTVIIYSLISPVFRIATMDGLIRLNPTEGVINDMKKDEKYKTANIRHALTEEQQKIFINYVKTSKKYSKWYPLLICIIGTGCRISEMLGLRWCDINWRDNTISVNHNLTYRLQEDGTVKMRITTTKTETGTREIPMFQAVQKALKDEQKRQAEEGFCKVEIEGCSGFIWIDKKGSPIKAKNFNYALDKIQKAYNEEEKKRAEEEHRQPKLLPHFSAHHLRHTFCVRLCENETDLKLIQEIMGHKSITTTMNIYNESNIERKKERFKVLDEKVFGVL